MHCRAVACAGLVAPERLLRHGRDSSYSGADSVVHCSIAYIYIARRARIAHDIASHARGGGAASHTVCSYYTAT
eukprot:COSAG01_NODE_2545_length_7469_cov_6.612890_2_plen_74_part_00